ncbi:MAG: von Willebrand factor type A domain-containing protein [Lachnospiraceae bacterium]
MKKKILTRLMVGLIGASILAGCGNTDDTGDRESRRRNREETQETRNDHGDENDVKDVDVEDDMETDGGMYVGAMEEICGATEDGMYNEACYDTAMSCFPEYVYEYPEYNTEEYSTIIENGFCDVYTSPLSTFSADVDTASYSNLRRMILSYGYAPEDIPSGAIRTEEMLNYFSYDYDGPKGDEPFGVNAMISDCPWNEDAKLLMLGLQTEAIDFSDAGDSNLVFLIDVSGSMYDENKLPLLKQAFSMLAENLGEKDRVSIVTYASSNEVVIEGVPGSEQELIIGALESLEAGGSTNGGEGIITAYQLAEKYFIEGGNNRVIIATDGDLNVGITSESELHDLISEEKESGVFLSVLGFGMGNYSDTNMETLADYGNGNYAYIDSLSEARKVLVEEMGATLVTVAKDVKLQVEFNPAVVAQYRLIGYENRTMAAEDFDDDTKDAGEIGAGHSVTVLYELVLAQGDESQGNDLRYQTGTLTEQAQNSGEWLTLSVRYKEPDGEESKLCEYPIGNDYYTETPNTDFRFAACVAEFSLLLRDSDYLGSATYEQLLNELHQLRGLDEYQQEFITIVETVE